MKAAKGTEYVNAQVEELKETIDGYADKISKMSSGAIQGMVYHTVVLDPYNCGLIAVSIQGDRKRVWDSELEEYVMRNRYYLRASGGLNRCGAWEKTINTGIIDAVTPFETVTFRAQPSWFDYSPDVHVYVSLSPAGRLHISVEDGPSGQFNSGTYYFHDQYQ